MEKILFNSKDSPSLCLLKLSFFALLVPGDHLGVFSFIIIQQQSEFIYHRTLLIFMCKVWINSSICNHAQRHLILINHELKICYNAGILMPKPNPQFKERWMYVWHKSSSDYWFNQMYYGTHGPFKRAEAGQAITFENDKVR